MKVAIDIITKRIVDLLPDNIDNSSAFIKNNGYVILDIDNPILSNTENEDGTFITIFRDLTNVELYPILHNEWKKERQILVDNIIVNYKDVDYQGDETSQNRLSRAINVIGDEDIIEWKDFDNNTQVLKKTDLQSILYLAGQKQEQLWFLNEPTLEE